MGALVLEKGEWMVMEPFWIMRILFARMMKEHQGFGHVIDIAHSTLK